MKYSLGIAFLLTSLEGSCQVLQIMEGAEFADSIKSRSKDLREFSVDTKRPYPITSEGVEGSDLEGSYKISADLIVNNDPFMMIRNAEASVKGDTLDILITDKNESGDYNFQIQIVRTKCYMFYDYSHPVDEDNRKLEILDFSLTLNSGEFKKGKVVRGYVNYHGRCVSYCEYNSSNEVKIEGDFVVTIQ
ncbi:MAG: hypothetical protein QM762_24300 [Chryseolinea sp.]